LYKRAHAMFSLNVFCTSSWVSIEIRMTSSHVLLTIPFCTLKLSWLRPTPYPLHHAGTFLCITLTQFR